jgi:hypothetical protein
VSYLTHKLASLYCSNCFKDASVLCLFAFSVPHFHLQRQFWPNCLVMEYCTSIQYLLPAQTDRVGAERGGGRTGGQGQVDWKLDTDGLYAYPIGSWLICFINQKLDVSEKYLFLVL